MWKVVCLVPSNFDEKELKSVIFVVERFESIGPTLHILNAVLDEEHFVKIYFLGEKKK